MRNSIESVLVEELGEYPPTIIGGAGFYKYLEDLKKDDSINTLILDGGNFFQGTNFGMNDKGKTMGEWMNKLEYDVFVPGQYDFIFGVDNLNTILKNANFSIVGANLDCDNCIENLKPYVIKNIDGVKVGIIGIVNSEISELVPKSKLNDILIEYEKDALNKWVPEIKSKGADIVIGAHPHVVQPSFWDKKDDTYVAYSLGNFMGYQSQPKTSKGMVVKINISRDKIESVEENLVTTRLYPINLTPYMEYVNKFSQAVKDTHVKNKIGDIDVFFPIKETNKPTKLITSGLQGDEPAGPIALLKWVQSNKSPSNIIFIPILSQESYVNKTHFDNSGLNVNHKIPYDPSYEIKELINPLLIKKMSSGGFLSCQEDPNRDASYIMVWKNNNELIKSFLEILEDNFKIRVDSDNGVRTSDVIKELDTLGNYCAKLGAPFSIATETPVINTNINKRVDAQVSMITKFVEYNGTV